MPLINREQIGNILLIDRKCNGNMLLINRKLAELEDDAKYAFLQKLIKFVKKLSKLIKTGKKKSYCLISHSLTCFVEPVRQPCFCFAKGLMSLTDGLAIGRAELRGREVTISFLGDLCEMWRLFSKCA